MIILCYITLAVETGHSVTKEIMQSHCTSPFSISSTHWVSPYLPASSATNPSSWAQRSPAHCWWFVCQSWLLPAAEPAQSGTRLHCTKQRRAMRRGFYMHTYTHTHTKLWKWHMGFNFCLHPHCVVAEFVCSCQGSQQSVLWRTRCKRWKNRSLRTGRWTLWRWDCHQTQSGCDASLWHDNRRVSDFLIKND